MLTLIYFMLLACNYIYCAGATNFVKKLDRRYERQLKGNQFQRKRRVLGEASQLPAMPGPAWAVKEVPNEAEHDCDDEEADHMQDLNQETSNSPPAELDESSDASFAED
jgi:hypothetical protein